MPAAAGIIHDRHEKGTRSRCESIDVKKSGKKICAGGMRITRNSKRLDRTRTEKAAKLVAA